MIHDVGLFVNLRLLMPFLSYFRIKNALNKAYFLGRVMEAVQQYSAYEVKNI